MSFSTAIGALSKAAFRIEGGATSGTGLQSTTYPISETTADAEEVLLKSSDQLHLLSESIEEEFVWVPDNTMTGTPGADRTDNVSIMVSGTIELSGFYDGMDAIIACAMGLEQGQPGDGPVAQNATDLTDSGSSAAGTWDDASTPFDSGDIGMFIQCDDSSSDIEGQVRRIDGFTDSNTVSITPNWTVTPSLTQSGKMAQEWLHTFELTNDLQDEDWDVVDGNYNTAGIGASGDRIVRRGTLGLKKANSIPVVYRSTMINSLTFNFNATDGLTLSAEILAFSRDVASGTNTTGTSDSWAFDHASPLFVENEKIMFSDADHFRINTFANGELDSNDDYGISDFSLTINNQLKGDDQSVISGLRRIQPGRNAQREITFSFTLPRTSTDQFTTWMQAKTILTAELSVSGSTIASSARNITFYMASLQLLTVSSPIGGPGIVPTVVTARCLTPDSALSGTPNPAAFPPRSELMIETLNQNPYSAFRDQNREY